jgi:hypothetical protein
MPVLYIGRTVLKGSYALCLFFADLELPLPTSYVIILQSVRVSQEIMYCGQTFGIQTRLRIHGVGFENVQVGKVHPLYRH